MRIVKAQACSVLLHAVLLGALPWLASRSLKQPREHRATATILAEPRAWKPVRVARGRSGGSNSTLLPARKGAAPPKGLRTFIPPQTRPDPKLPMEITVAYDAPIIAVDRAAMGDPASQVVIGGWGQKGGGGIGDGPRGPGLGTGGSGAPGMVFDAHDPRIQPPVLIYKVEPEFSEQARKAKYQGTVLLTIEVDSSGHARNLRIVRGLGLGLDEKAIEAVSQWLFRPGVQGGRPVVTSATVEVNFRLL